MLSPVENTYLINLRDFLESLENPSSSNRSNVILFATFSGNHMAPTSSIIVFSLAVFCRKFVCEDTTSGSLARLEDLVWNTHVLQKHCGAQACDTDGNAIPWWKINVALPFPR